MEGRVARRGGRWGWLAALALVLGVACKSTPAPIPDEHTIRGLAEISEVVDDATVVVMSTGYGYDQADATRDAYRAGVWAVAASLALSDLEKVNVEGYKGALIDDPNPWIKDVRELGGGPEGAWMRVSLQLRIDRGGLRAHLEQRGILTPIREVVARVDYPTVMVVSQTGASGPEAVSAQNEAVAFLSDRGFEVLDAGAAAELGAVRDQLLALSVGQDPLAAAALSVGADVYVVVEAVVQDLGGSRQGAGSVKAYETTTARLLGAGNSVSHQRAEGTSSDAYLAAEAVRDATSKVIDGVLTAWKRSVDEGRSYYIVVDGALGDSAHKREVKAILTEAAGERLTLKVETPQTMEFTARSKEDLSDLGDRIEVGLEKAGIRYTWIAKNRQMLLLHVD